MFNMYYDDVDPYFLNPNHSPQEQDMKKERKTGARNKYWEKEWGDVIRSSFQDARFKRI